ncbi:TIGR03364 family FAD-dependent oxidoreductase [Nocardioides houyundeii]|uniref:TIGR03364 family FAD-dependent oxidoreductase n=1 Tax=Nocardioides houyundeii TaxID=2045452 RepID=UPI000C75BA6D|nr:TIGR03364 family FAD-dependent oxidoreductase [Nocardioides houyundeii]
MTISAPTDLAVVGAGIVGLAHAVAATERGLRVTVLERDQRAVGASLRNFGHVCTTAQTGTALEYAWEARDHWLRLGEKASFPVTECGTVVVARSAAELAVLEEFAAERGEDQVRLLDASGVGSVVPGLATGVLGGAHLRLDLRVDPRVAVPALTRWLEKEGVDIRWGTHVGAIEPGLVRTSQGDLRASRIVHATGHDLDRLFPAVAAEHEVRRCRLHMFEVAPPGGVRIDPAVLTGTAMLRYGGLASCPSAAAVRAELVERTPELLDVEMNLMLTQRPDGAIVLGDTHHYERTSTPFEDEAVSALVLREAGRLFGAELAVLRRWRGVYAHSPSTDFVTASPEPGVRVVSVTSGIGMTTAFGLAQAVIDQLF